MLSGKIKTKKHKEINFEQCNKHIYIENLSLINLTKGTIFGISGLITLHYRLVRFLVTFYVALVRQHNGSRYLSINYIIIHVWII